MLNNLVADIADEQASIDPVALADTMGVSLGELAKLAQVSRNTLAARPLKSRGIEALRPIVKILSLAANAAGSEPRAIIWFKFNPIISLGTKTAMEHVADGNADWVLAHIEDVLNGVYS